MLLTKFDHNGDIPKHFDNEELIQFFNNSENKEICFGIASSLG
jgi:protein involved in ribonucleotide reduction